MDQWYRHRWKGAPGPVGHADLWSKIHFLVTAHGDTLSFQRVPSHTDIKGNEEADRLAEEGREKQVSCAMGMTWSIRAAGEVCI